MHGASETHISEIVLMYICFQEYFNIFIELAYLNSSISGIKPKTAATVQ